MGLLMMAPHIFGLVCNCVAQVNIQSVSQMRTHPLSRLGFSHSSTFLEVNILSTQLRTGRKMCASSTTSFAPHMADLVCGKQQDGFAAGQYGGVRGCNVKLVEKLHSFDAEVNIEAVMLPHR